jgi:hypothetical protein
MAQMASFNYQMTIIEKCPGCGKSVTARVAAALEVESAVIGDGRVEAAGVIQGLRIDHDCIPKVAR